MTPLPPLPEIDRLLIVKTSSLGDVLHALPAVEAIKTARPELLLGWVVRARCADVLRGNPVIDRLYVVPNRPTARDLMHLRRQLHAARYQCALDMQGLLLSGLLTWLSGAPVRVGWDRNREQNALFLTHPLISGKPSVHNNNGIQHEIDLLYGFAEHLGVCIPHPNYPPQSYLAQENAGLAQEWLKALPQPRIALNVGAARAYKRWPIEHWTCVADSLLDLGYGVVFVGDKNDAETVASVKSQMHCVGPLIDLSGETTLRQLASVLAVCALVISGDTGPMHLAVAVGTPVVAIFGATNPARHGPYGSRHRVLHRRDAVVTHRRPTEAEGVAAMRAIQPAEVLEAVEAQLSCCPEEAWG